MISGEALWWLPSAAALVMTALALFAARARPPGTARSGWTVGVLLAGIVAVALSAWQQATIRAAMREETARLAELGSRLNELGGLLPAGPGTTPDETFDTVTTEIRTLNTRIAELDEQIRNLQQKARRRTIEPDVALQVAQYLRQFAPQRVVVSCVPDDVEAFAYANQIVTTLRDGGWEALGPEKTTIFGEAPAMAVKLVARSGVAPPDAARLLIDVFNRFNIPYQSGVAPSDAIPDPATAELFISRKS